MHGEAEEASDRVPSVVEARRLAGELLGSEGTRLAHVGTAGTVARRLSALFTERDAELLVVAATLHDIGYSQRVAHSGFHPLDGGRLLLSMGYSPRLAGLVANHSWAAMHADAPHAEALGAEFPREEGLLVDALAYADMHSAPDGRVIPARQRLADIAARHPDPRQLDRARALRAAIVRVGVALLEVGAGPAPHRLELPRQRTLDLRARVGGRTAVPEGASEDSHIHEAFDTWWSAEARCREELDGYRPGDAARERESAVRRAHLRAVADRGRDRFFRRALS